MNKKNVFLAACSSLLLGVGVAQADIATPKHVVSPQPHPTAGSNRDPVALARRDPEISKQIVAARGGTSDRTGPATPTETAVQVALSGQCGFAGCSSSTLVAFSFRSSGANPTTETVLALVNCPPVPSVACTVAPAEVRASGNASNSK